MKKRIVIIGFGETGVLTAVNLPKQYQITAINTKPLLLSGQELGLRISRPAFWAQDYLNEYAHFKKLNGINILHGTVERILDKEQAVKIVLADGSTHREPYDALLIASGTSNGFWRNATVESTDSIQQNLLKHAQQFASAKTIAIVGGGPSAVSAAYNLAKQSKNQALHLFFPGEQALPHYAPATRDKISALLEQAGVISHPHHRAIIDINIDGNNALQTNIELKWQTNLPNFNADLALFAIGNIKPNNGFIPKEMLTEQGFVRVNPYLQVKGYDNIFAVGDIADTDTNRSSARNAGFIITAKNMHAYLSGKKQNMKAFKAPEHRWGSILGAQEDDGLRIFSPNGKQFCVSPWWVRKVLFPFFVHKMIYGGRKQKHP